METGKIFVSHDVHDVHDVHNVSGIGLLQWHFELETGEIMIYEELYVSLKDARYANRWHW